jgi:hypothetical protein
MFLIKKSRIDRARAATSPAAKLAEIQSMLATAVTIELSTLPPYLSAVFSADPGSNREAVSIIQSVTVEEMLHMTLASNTLIALGGNPVINDLDALPSYPGHLPDVAPDLVVTIKSLTREHVREVFMGIERPDTTACLPGETKEEADYHRALLSNDEYVSIGQFYAEIKSQIEELAKIKPDLFECPRVDQQVPATKYFNVQFKDNPLGYVTSLSPPLT